LTCYQFIIILVSIMYESPAVLIGAPRILSITVWEILVYGCLFWSLFFIFKNQTYQTYQKKKKN